MRRQPEKYLPTESEIAEACEAIRAAWPTGEHRQRQHGRIHNQHAKAAAADVPQGWQPPVVEAADLYGGGDTGE